MLIFSSFRSHNIFYKAFLQGYSYKFWYIPILGRSDFSSGIVWRRWCFTCFNVDPQVPVSSWRLRWARNPLFSTKDLATFTTLGYRSFNAGRPTFRFFSVTRFELQTLRLGLIWSQLMSTFGRLAKASSISGVNVWDIIRLHSAEKCLDFSHGLSFAICECSSVGTHLLVTYTRSSEQKKLKTRVHLQGYGACFLECPGTITVTTWLTVPVPFVTDFIGLSRILWLKVSFCSVFLSNFFLIVFFLLCSIQ